jgi:hypothetical protein
MLQVAATGINEINQLIKDLKRIKIAYFRILLGHLRDVIE